MKPLLTRLILISLCLIGLSGSLAQDIPTISIGDSAVVDSSPDNPAFVNFLMAQPGYVTITARGDTSPTTPLLALFDGTRQLDLAGGDEPPSTSATLSDVFLLAGVYQIGVQTSLSEGTEAITVQVSEGTTPGTGVGIVQVINAEFGADEQYVLRVELVAGELLNLMAIANEPLGLDLMLRVQDSAGQIIAQNDDHELFEPILGDLDPKIDSLFVPESGEYLVIANGFSAEDSGAFRLVIQRFGVIDTASATVETLTGRAVARSRNTFPLEGRAGELLTITVRATDGTLDPEFFLLDPDLIFVARNDDHNTEREDLGLLDARVEGIILPQTGVYTLEVNSVTGTGGFEVTIERLGVLTTQSLPAIDPANFSITEREFIDFD